MKVPMGQGLFCLGLGPMGGSACEASWSVGLMTEVKDPVTLCVLSDSNAEGPATVLLCLTAFLISLIF